MQRCIFSICFSVPWCESGKDSVNLGNENMVSASTLAETVHSPDDFPYSEEEGNVAIIIIQLIN
jgi:hypothetical protein